MIPICMNPKFNIIDGRGCLYLEKQGSGEIYYVTSTGTIGFGCAYGEQSFNGDPIESRSVKGFLNVYDNRIMGKFKSFIVSGKRIAKEEKNL